jgi:hypothetical protein
MSGLERRVGALEAIAEEARRRELRDLVRRLAAARGVPAAPVWEHFERLQAETARVGAAGLSVDAIFALKASRLGIPVEEMRRRADELVRRLS